MSEIDLEPWSRAIPVAGRVLIPLTVPRPGTPLIRYLRAMSIVFGLSLVLILLVMLQLDETRLQFKKWPLWIWAVSGIASVVACAAFRRSRSAGVIGAPDPSVALLKYRQRHFLLIAFAEVPSLLAFAVFFEVGVLTPYLVSLPISLALVAWASPREGDVRQLQEAIVETGGTLDLVAALMEPRDCPAPRFRRRNVHGG